MLRLICICLACSAKAWAGPAEVEYLFPAGGQRGSSVRVQVPELGEKAQFWTDHAELTVKLTGKDQVQISMGEGLPLGLHWLRFYDAKGASAPRWFSVGALTEAQETEPNHTSATAMPVDHLPVCMNGVLEEHSCLDFFAFQLEVGDTLTAALEAYQLGSEVDAYLELYDASGQIIATAHDGRSLDPVLIYPVAKSGRYMLQVAGFLHPPSSTVKYAGAESLVYRLHLHQKPVVTHCYPAAVSRTQSTTLTLQGSANLAASQHSLDVQAQDRPAEPAVQSLDVPAALGPLTVFVTDSPIQKESEPNETATRATPLAMNAVMAGRLDSVTDTDGYTFQVKKGQFYRLELHAQDLLLPLDGCLTLYDGDKVLAENDDEDGPGSDAVLSWKSTLDGPVRVVVSSLLAASGPGAQYVLCLKPGEEPLEAQITSGSVTLTAGKTAEIKGKLMARNGYSGKIRAQLQNLPLGLSADAVEVKPRHGEEFAIILRSAKNAKDWSGPIQLALWASDKEGVSTTVLGYHLPRGEAQRGRTMLDRLEHVWVTIHSPK